MQQHAPQSSMSYALNLADEVERVLATLPEGAAHAVLRPFAAPLVIADASAPSLLALPYWIAFPVLLLTEGKKTPLSDKERSRLDGILRAQTLLFLAVRLHDDVFDGHRDDPSLLYVGDLLLLRALREYQELFPGRSEFWSLFHRELGLTWTAILATDAAQRRNAEADATQLTTSEACDAAFVNALFRIGIAAACRLRRATTALPAWLRCADALAVAEQLLDDFEDMEDDLERGRLNAAAQVLLGGAARPGGATRDEVLDALGVALLQRGASALFDAIAALYRDAESAAHEAGSASALAFIAVRRDQCSAINTRCHQQRVEWLFR